MVLTTGKDAKYIEQPVKVTIDDPTPSRDDRWGWDICGVVGAGGFATGFRPAQVAPPHMRR